MECPKCAKQISNKEGFCPGCGSPIKSDGKNKSGDGMKNLSLALDEIVLYQNKELAITNRRILLENQTHRVSNIESTEIIPFISTTKAEALLKEDSTPIIIGKIIFFPIIIYGALIDFISNIIFGGYFQHILICRINGKNIMIQDYLFNYSPLWGFCKTVFRNEADLALTELHEIQNAISKAMISS